MTMLIPMQFPLVYLCYNCSCFLSERPLSLGVTIPIAVVLSHNFIMFALVFHSLMKNRFKENTVKNDRHDLWKRLRHGIFITLLLGLTWVFGLLAIGDAGVLFAWLFVLFNAFQGTGIFVVFCILQDDVKKTLKPYFKWVNALKCKICRRVPVPERYTVTSKLSLASTSLMSATVSTSDGNARDISASDEEENTEL